MRVAFLAATAAALLRGAGCEARLARALAAAEQEPVVQAAPPGSPVHAERAQARVFWALRRGCGETYRRWERSRLPAACQAEFESGRWRAELEVPAGGLQLRRWNESAATTRGNGSIAYLVSVSQPSALPLVLRTFRRLHRPGDSFVYLVDTAAAPGYDAQLAAALEDAVPSSGAKVLAARSHSVMYFWPRVDAVLGGLQALLNEEGNWSYAVHLSEHDYPLRPKKLHRLAAQTAPGQRPLVMDAVPRDASRAGARDDWYWWRERTAVFVCNRTAAPDPDATFPDDQLESRGVSLHRGSEWFALPREVLEYVVRDPAAAPGVASFVSLLQHRWSVDEVFWPTLLLSVPGLERPVKAGWYVKWDAQHGHSPDTFAGIQLSKHRAEILRSDRLFVRKVSLPGSADLLDTLDARA